MSRYALQPRILRAGHENLEETNVTGHDNLVNKRQPYRGFRIDPRSALLLWIV